MAYSGEEKAWIERIRAALVENLSLGLKDFDTLPVSGHAGG